MDELVIRDARSQDAPGLAGALLEWGRLYAELDPEAFHVPESGGLIEWFEDQLREERDDDSLWLVATVEEHLVGYIQAQVWRPSAGSERQIMREADETVLKIDAVIVSETQRRAGVGTALMEAAGRL